MALRATLECDLPRQDLGAYQENGGRVETSCQAHQGRIGRMILSVEEYDNLRLVTLASGYEFDRATSVNSTRYGTSQLVR